MEEFIFEKLAVWQKSKDLVTAVYRQLDNFPNTERYALCDQIRRAIVSVPSNIAEGSGRASVKEKIHFLEIAYGSLMETYCQLMVAVDLNYITQEAADAIKPNFVEVAKMISGWRNHLKSKLT
jgi:four helix bundle protein